MQMGLLWKCVTGRQEKNVRLRQGWAKGIPVESMMGARKVPSSFGWMLGLCHGNHKLTWAPLGHAAHLTRALGEHIILPKAAKTPGYPPENEISFPFSQGRAHVDDGGRSSTSSLLQMQSFG